MWATTVKQEPRGHLQLEDLCCVLLLEGAWGAGGGGAGLWLPPGPGAMESSAQVLDLWLWQEFQVQQTRDAQGGGRW